MANWPPETPKVTVDAVIRTEEGIVLVERRYEPYGWALPGGFVDIGETVEAAVIREAKEETGLDIEHLWLVGVYSEPKQDPRFHTVSIIFGATARGIPVGADDAKTAAIFTENTLPEKIAFDHRRILEDFFRQERDKGLEGQVELQD